LPTLASFRLHYRLIYKIDLSWGYSTYFKTLSSFNPTVPITWCCWSPPRRGRIFLSRDTVCLTRFSARSISKKLNITVNAMPESQMTYGGVFVVKLLHYSTVWTRKIWRRWVWGSASTLSVIKRIRLKNSRQLTFFSPKFRFNSNFYRTRSKRCELLHYWMTWTKEINILRVKLCVSKWSSSTKGSVGI